MHHGPPAFRCAEGFSNSPTSSDSFNEATSFPLFLNSQPSLSLKNLQFSNMAALSPSNVERLTERVNLACKNPDKDLPGVSVAVIGKDGNELFAHAAGQRGHGSSEAMNTDNVFWIASCTKMIVGMACMQLVERGLISLDDSDAVERYCPELKEVKVLQPDGELVEKKRGITLRMLLTHTGMFLCL